MQTLQRQLSSSLNLVANDKMAEELDYVPLTAAQKADVKKVWSNIK